MSALTVEKVQGMTARGLTDAEIAAQTGKARQTVQGFRKTHGIPASGPIGLTRRGEMSPPPPAATSGETPSRKAITVAEFLLNKRKAVCPVCQLKEPVKAAVIEAKKKGERTADILEYLQVCHRVTIQPRDYQAHFTSRHDQ